MSCDEALKQSWQECGEGQAYIRIDASTRIEKERERERESTGGAPRQKGMHSIHPPRCSLLVLLDTSEERHIFFLKRKMRL